MFQLPAELALRFFLNLKNSARWSATAPARRYNSAVTQKAPTFRLGVRSLCFAIKWGPPIGGEWQPLACTRHRLRGVWGNRASGDSSNSRLRDSFRSPLPVQILSEIVPPLPSSKAPANDVASVLAPALAAHGLDTLRMARDVIIQDNNFCPISAFKSIRCTSGRAAQAAICSIKL